MKKAVAPYQRFYTICASYGDWLCVFELPLTSVHTRPAHQQLYFGSQHISPNPKNSYNYKALSIGRKNLSRTHLEVISFVLTSCI